MIQNLMLHHPSNIYKYEDLYPLNNIRVTLDDESNLWPKFHELDTEMIITKTGRRMFPSLKVKITDMNPREEYCILLEMTPASHCRFKYSNSGGWAAAGTEEAQSRHRMYLHPDSPKTGEQWMSQPISFEKLKLTNTTAPEMGNVVLSSMHKYQPRILIVKACDSRNIAWVPKKYVAFPETQFIAVTAYQNERITRLKIDNNPFAKGFRENGQSKTKRKRGQSDDEQQEEVTPEKKCQKTHHSTTPEKNLEDRLSPCLSSPSSSTPSTPEVSPRSRGISASSPITPNATTPTKFQGYQHNPYNYNLPHQTPLMGSLYPYYYPPYPGMMYPPMWNAAHYYYHQSLSPPVAQDLTVQNVEVKPKKLTDFSIRAITGQT